MLRLSPDPAGRPLAIFDALAERFAAQDFRGCAFVNAIIEVANRRHAIHAAADSHKRQVTAYVAQLLTVLPVGDADTLAEQFMILIDGAIVTAVREGTPQAAAAAKQVAALLLRVATLTPYRR